VVSEVGPHSRTWVLPPDSSGPAGASPGSSHGGSGRVVELASGMNYWTGTEYVPSDPVFEVSPDGDAFLATRVQHKVRISEELNQPGAITVVTPDGVNLHSTPVAIGLYDSVSGRFAIVSGVTNCRPVQVEPNRVVFENAFAGAICASVVYTVNNGSFEQDAVITGRFHPRAFGFSTNCLIQIITEMYDVPEPERVRRPLYVEDNPALRRAMASPDFVDEVLRWGELAMPTGEAFMTPTSTTNATRAVVAKEFRRVGDRTFLIESISYQAVEKAVAALPDCAPSGYASLGREHSLGSDYAAIPAPSARRTGSSHESRIGLLAKAASVPSGLTIDYIQVIGPGHSTPATFAADTTYFVSGPVNCGSVVMEAAVFKFPNSTGQSPVTNATIQIGGTLTLKTSMYRPTIFTAWDDESIGESLYATWENWLGDTQGDFYANPAVSLVYSPATLSNMRFSYCQEAVKLVGTASSTFTIKHSQFVNCLRAIKLEGGSGSGSSAAPLLSIV
jgi:hypothetical protein